MIKKLKIFTFLAIIILNSISFAQTVQEKGSTTLTLGKGRRVCVKETGRPYDKKIHVQAISKAKLAAWNSYVSKFSPDKSKAYYKNESKFVNSLDNYVISFDIIDSECSEKTRTYSIFLRASINNRKVDNELTSTDSSEGSKSLANQGVVVLVVPRKTTELITFKARETKVTEKSQSNDVDEIVNQDGDSVSISSSSSQRNIESSGGSTVTKSAKRKYDIGDLNDADAQINNLLQPLKMRTFSAARLESMATRNGYDEFLKKVLDQFSGKVGDYGANISPQTKEEIINLIIDIGRGKLNYFLLGTVDSGTPRIDPDTGVFKSEVLVNVQLYRIDDFFGAEAVASVGPEIQSAFGETDVLAEKAGLNKAFELVTTSLFFKLN
jgi:predicted Fe-Mo cluster-binding NifX family protein